MGYFLSWKLVNNILCKLHAKRPPSCTALSCFTTTRVHRRLFRRGEKVREVVAEAEAPSSAALGGLRAAAADTRPAIHGLAKLCHWSARDLSASERGDAAQINSGAHQ